MMTYSRIILMVASFMSTPVWAKDALPNDDDLRIARQRMGNVMKEIVPEAPGNPLSVPKTGQLPKPDTNRADIEQIAESFSRSTSPSLKNPSAMPELMVFASFSIPKEALERIISQSEKSGAVIVFRGLKDDSLTRMGEQIAKIIGTRNVTAIIHPPAFKQFKVKRVPALVLARPVQAAKVTEDGCAESSSYIKVDGDVTQDYAMRIIEREAPDWADVARGYEAKLAGRP